MGLTRKSRFGFPPPANAGSQYTHRSVPLSQGVNLGAPWPLLPPGSTTSMTNFWPLDGRLQPRSRLSSLNTIRTLDSVLNMAECARTDLTPAITWLSAGTLHGVMTSTGSISKASFVSSFGLGVSGLVTQSGWQYAQVYSDNLDENILLATPIGSTQTIMALYQTAGGSNGLPLYSYLTAAPRAGAVGSFDNYVIAFNITAGSVAAASRVQWPARGSISNWTGEGSGFEDLLQARGFGTAVWPLTDGRFLLFTDREIWQGVSATYPQQFSFSVLDQDVGCLLVRTIANTDAGILFIGSDRHLRLIPKGGGPSQVVPTPIDELLRNLANPSATADWAVYDPRTHLYQLTLGGKSYVLNVRTGEWGFTAYASPNPGCGLTVIRINNAGHEGVLYGNSTGTVYSSNSLIAQENGSVVTSTWKSAPIAPDLPGNYKQLTQLDVDYRATSVGTLTVKISQDGGNTYETTGAVMSLASAPVSGRAELDVYRGGAFPTIQFESTSTGIELHRVDLTMQIGGRR